MKIETKFDKEQTIFFIGGNRKVQSGIIKSIRIEIEPKNTSIIYLCGTGAESVRIKVDETDAFSSKQDLLDSL